MSITINVHTDYDICPKNDNDDYVDRDQYSRIRSNKFDMDHKSMIQATIDALQLPYVKEHGNSTQQFMAINVTMDSAAFIIDHHGDPRHYDGYVRFRFSIGDVKCFMMVKISDSDLCETDFKIRIKNEYSYRTIIEKIDVPYPIGDINLGKKTEEAFIEMFPDTNPKEIMRFIFTMMETINQEMDHICYT